MLLESIKWEQGGCIHQLPNLPSPNEQHLFKSYVKIRFQLGDKPPDIHNQLSTAEHVEFIWQNWAINLPNMGVAVPRAPVGTRSPEPPILLVNCYFEIKFHKIIRVNPPPPPPPLNEQNHHYNDWEYTCRLRDLDLLPIKYFLY